MASDRREFQRLSLAKPILALLEGQNALIIDVGIGGAYVEHYGTSGPGERFHLLFRWKSEDIEFLCEVRRSAVVRGSAETAVSHTGMRFVEAVGDSEARLQDMMATFVGRVLAAQRMNASGDAGDSSDATLAQLGAARRARSRGYRMYRYLNGKWSLDATDSPQQPQHGFTVAAYEDEEELETLCRAWEIADEEGRRLIRLVAELSARSMRR
ncbi:MAG: PilZ domain-containing protein [Acidobacteriota bacterium]